MNVYYEHFVTCGQMKLLERRADEDGLSYYQMMENAGTKAAELIMKNARGKRTLIFCGKGNNGGDGFVVARVMAAGGWDAKVVLVDGEPKTKDSITNLKKIRQKGIDVYDMEEDAKLVKDFSEDADVLIDAIYGTGFHGKLEGSGLEAATYINSRKNNIYAFSLDIPSGLGGDMTEEKELDTSAIKADYTITFHAKKPIHLQKFAANYCGDILIADIGIDEIKLMDSTRY